MPRDYIRLRATSDRELLLEKAKERFGLEEDAATVDEALKRALSFTELVDELRAEAVDAAKYRTEYHEIKVSTALQTRK